MKGAGVWLGSRRCGEFRVEGVRSESVLMEVGWCWRCLLIFGLLSVVRDSER